MEKELSENNKTNIFAFNDAMILDKIQELLNGQELEDLDLTPEKLELLRNQLIENISSDEVNDSVFILAENIEELTVLPKEDIKDYIKRIKDYLDTTTVKFIKAEYKGVEFEVCKDSSIDDLFKDYYSKYDEMYGITDMLYDLGLK